MHIWYDSTITKQIIATQSVYNDEIMIYILFYRLQEIRLWPWTHADERHEPGIWSAARQATYLEAVGQKVLQNRVSQVRQKQRKSVDHFIYVIQMSYLIFYTQNRHQLHPAPADVARLSARHVALQLLRHHYDVAQLHGAYDAEPHHDVGGCNSGGDGVVLRFVVATDVVVRWLTKKFHPVQQFVSILFAITKPRRRGCLLYCNNII